MTNSSQARKEEAIEAHSHSRAALAALASRTSYVSFVIGLLFALCTLFYYLGELIDFAGWEGLPRDFFYGVHDVHRLLFFIPIIYAGYVFRVRGALIVTVAAFLVFLPRALSISPYPHPLLRMSLFVVSGGVMGVLTGMVRNETERRGQLEALVKNERDRLLGMLEIIGEGVLLIDPEYRIRFMNRSMARKLGESIGSLC